MKKVLLLLVVAMAGLAANAQVYTGGSLSIWGSDGNHSFRLAPEVGYNFSDQWAVAGTLLFEHAKAGGTKATGFALAPYVRYTFLRNERVDLFVDGGIGFATSKIKGASDRTNGFEFGFRPGLSIKATQRLSLVAKVGFLGYRDDYLNYSNGGGVSVSGEDLSFGLYYSF